MALFAVDLSQASKRISVPTLDHDLILGNAASAVGSRAGVASLLVIKNLIGGGGVTVSSSAPTSPAAGNLWWDTSGNPDAGLKIRIGISWLLVVTGIPTLPGNVSRAEAEAGTVTGTRLWSPTQGGSGHRCAGVEHWINDEQRGHRRSGSSRGRWRIARADTRRLVPWWHRLERRNLAPGQASGSARRRCENVGTSAGDVIVLGTNNLIATGRLGTGTKTVQTCLRGDQSYGAYNP